jgi:hypothetical protein
MKVYLQKAFLDFYLFNGFVPPGNWSTPKGSTYQTLDFFRS